MTHRCFRCGCNVAPDHRPGSDACNEAWKRGDWKTRTTTIQGES